MIYPYTQIYCYLNYEFSLTLCAIVLLADNVIRPPVLALQISAEGVFIIRAIV